MEKLIAGKQHIYIFTLKEYLSLYSEGKISIELISEGQNIQRGDVWNLAKKTNLIESFLCQDEGFIIPPLFAIEKNIDDSNVFELGDGKQRTLTIVNFINNQYKLGKLSYKGMDLSKKRFAELTPDLQDKLLKATIAVIATPFVSDSQVQEVFTRLNDGEKLRPIEKLRAKLAKELPFLTEITNSSFFIETLRYKESERKRFADIDLALSILMQEYSLGTDLNVKSKEKFAKDLTEKIELKDDFKKKIISKLDYMNKIFVEAKISDKEKKLVENVVLSNPNRIIMYMILEDCIQEEYDLQDIHDFFYDYYVTKGFHFKDIATTSSTSNKKSIEKRYTHLRRKLKAYMK